jgi:hypothetical protein
MAVKKTITCLICGSSLMKLSAKSWVVMGGGIAILKIAKRNLLLLSDKMSSEVYTQRKFG